MNSRQTRVAILLAGALMAGLPSGLFARPAASSPAAHRAPADDKTEVQALQAQVQALQAQEQALQAQVLELRKQQSHLLQQADEQARLLEQFKQVSFALRPATAPETFPTAPPADAPHRQPETPDSPRFDWMLGGFAIFACALCVIFLLRVRHPPEPERALLPPDEGDHTATPAADAEPSLPPLVHPILPALPDWDSASPALDLRAAEIFAPQENVQAHDSTIELAEIMLSFGRVNSAAEALAAFIENNPKEAIAPWLKLLEVYRESGQRAEFDKIARKLNKTFNARAVNWDNFNDSRDPTRGLEEIPHIVSRLQQLWGSRECQAYLQYLLHDTRDETRCGFSLTTIDDILCLNAILEHD
ncbi:MAG: hypothetical protein LBF91_08395, partial [Azoarcus sp.]|nr:hypothetical protein [Azoarcus sp.]